MHVRVVCASVIESYCVDEPNAAVSNSRLVDSDFKRSLKSTARVACAIGFNGSTGGGQVPAATSTVTSTCEADGPQHGKWSPLQLNCIGSLLRFCSVTVTVTYSSI